MEINKIMVSEEIKRALFDMGFENLTPIQEQAIPLLMEGKDLIGQSQTGTGKTAAFAIPILEKIDKNNRNPQALVLCPTRELAVQVANEFKKIAKYKHGIKTVAVYGGEPINRQIMAIKNGAQIIIGTPGRTIDHITKRRTLKTADISTLVLDEADEMLKMGFREDIELILQSIKDERQTILFSATMPKPILDITNRYQIDPQLIKVASKDLTADTVKQEYCEIKTSDKVDALFRLLAVHKPTRCIVFCNMKSRVDFVNEKLFIKGINAEKIHGDLRQTQRMQVLKRFNDAMINVLVATDVAARGLDIKEVDLIINFDVPEKPEYYVHRIGRSGRAGKDGHSITMVTKGHKNQFVSIMHYTKKQIEKIKIPTMKEVNDGKVQSFIQEISETIQNEKLDDYIEILNKFDTMYTIEDICASLIKHNIELEEITHENDINLMLKENYQSDNNSSRKSSKKSGKSKGDKNMVRIFMTVGRKDKVKPSHILGAVTGECDISGDKIGSIDILDKFTFFDVNKDVADKVVKKMNGQKINGRKVAVEKAKMSK
ncbi:MAG: DEAD/DEAH box helicase [Clostridiales bacterium]|nr:DEAD/DEAH box helicase [Clostridiales bacterium]